jgi:outer membrane protein OmpA-like peptidoglycan-associated protein
MKKSFSILVLLSIFAAGCGGGKQEKKEDRANKKSMDMPLAQSESVDAKSFFDTEADAFAFKDEFQGDKVAQNDQTISWVAEGDDAKSFKTIYFNFDESGIRIDQEANVKADIKKAREVVAKGENVIVEGHACHSAGSRTYNVLISERRAQEVAERLVNNGIGTEQIKVVARGTEMPLIKDGDREQQGPNRRVEIFGAAA